MKKKILKLNIFGGTSSGSIVAALYACGYSSDEIYTIFKKYCKKIKYVELKNILKLFFGIIFYRKIIIDGLNSGKAINKLINKFCNKKGIYNISDIKMPLVIPSVNMNNGEVVCFTSTKHRTFSDDTIFINDANIGNVVQASCSFPIVFSPCDYNNEKLLDGGIRENNPWKEVKVIGADKVLQVSFEEEKDNKCCKNLVDVAFRSFDLMCRELSKYEKDGVDYEILIKSPKISLLDNSKIDELYELGYKEAKKFLRKGYLEK